MILQTDFKKQDRNGLLRLKNFTSLLPKYKVFQLVTS